MQNSCRKSNGKVFQFPANAYAHLRAQCGIAASLRDDRDSPPEDLLQAVWQHQRLLRDRLKTLDGAPLRVLHPGFMNREGGPDFRGAVVQAGDAPARCGDVEVDLHAAGWRAHGHDRNPAFRNVILHVIWEGARSAFDGDRRATASGAKPSAESPPGIEPAPLTLVLSGCLDAPIGELSRLLSAESAEPLPETLRGRCCEVLRELSDEQRNALLIEAAHIRFWSKAAQFQARARQAGWEQALWEGLFRALGYKHNIWPMQCLAEQREQWLSPGLSALGLQARLLGISGLLPADLTRSQTDADGYLRKVWDRWWRERDAFDTCRLPEKLWRLHGQRPANHPQRRLALAAHWLAARGLTARLERWCAAKLPGPRLAPSLLKLLQIDRDDFWSWHWTIRSARLPRSQPLLGPARLTDIAVNAILPWLWMRAVEGDNPALQAAIEERFMAWPASEDNAVLRLARWRLGIPPRTLRGAARQQGLLQIVRDFCDRSNTLCDDCRFAELVRDWTVSINHKVTEPTGKHTP